MNTNEIVISEVFGNPDYVKIVLRGDQHYKIEGHYCQFNGLTITSERKVSPKQKIVKVWE